MLVEDALRSCTQYLTAVRRDESTEHRAKTYHSLVLHRNLRTTVRWITEREKGGGSVAKGNVHEDGGAWDEGAVHQTSGSMPPVCKKLGHIS